MKNLLFYFFDQINQKLFKQRYDSLFLSLAYLIQRLYCAFNEFLSKIWKFVILIFLGFKRSCLLGDHLSMISHKRSFWSQILNSFRFFFFSTCLWVSIFWEHAITKLPSFSNHFPIIVIFKTLFQPVIVLDSLYRSFAQ